MQVASLLQPALALDGIQRFFRWWQGELRDMLPKRKPSLDSSSDGLRIILDESGTVIQHIYKGEGRTLETDRQIDSLDEDEWDEIRGLADKAKRIDLVLRSEDCLGIRLNMPKASRAHIGTAITLQCAQRLPLQPEHVEYGWSMALADNWLDIDLVAARREQLDRLEALFDGQDIAAPAFLARNSTDRIVEVRAARSREADESRRYWVGAWIFVAAAILLTPFMTGLIAKWQVEDDRAVIAELEKKAAPRLMREREARANEASRLALRPLAMQRTLGETLSPIAANLASTDWVISMEAGEGRRLALRVDAAEADKLVEAMGRLSQFDDIEEQGRDPVGENRQRVTLEGRLK